MILVIRPDVVVANRTYEYKVEINKTRPIWSQWRYTERANYCQKLNHITPFCNCIKLLQMMNVIVLIGFHIIRVRVIYQVLHIDSKYNLNMKHF